MHRPKNDSRRRSFLGRNEVLLLPSDSDTSTEEEQAVQSPELRNHLPKGRRKSLRKWMTTSPFSSPNSGADKKKKNLDDFRNFGSDENMAPQASGRKKDASKRVSFRNDSRLVLSLIHI